LRALIQLLVTIQR